MPINYENNNITGSGSLFINNSGNFASGLYVNSVPVSLSGHTHLVADITNFGSGVSGLLPINLVYSTGNQNISGVKTFLDNVISSGQISAPSGRFDYITSDKDFTINGTMNISAAASILASGPIIFQSNQYVVSGTGYFTSGLYVGSPDAATPVSLSGHSHVVSDITNFGSGVSGLLPINLVYSTGNQNISGVKTFDNGSNSELRIKTLNNGTGSLYFVDGTHVGYLQWDGTNHDLIFDSTVTNSTFDLRKKLKYKAPSTGVVATSVPVFTGGNPSVSGEIISARSISDFKLDLSLNNVQNLALSGIIFTAGSGLVGGGSLSSDKTFDIGQGDGISVSTDSIAVDSSVVRTTGLQNISGTKTFLNQVNVSGNIVALTGYFTSGLFVGPTGSATPVSLSGHRQSYSTIDNFCTGVAECVNTPLLAGTGITLSYVDGTGLYINSSGIQISSSSSGFVVKTGINNYVTRYITNGNNINISYADGVSGNPVISLSGNLDLIQNITSTGNLKASSGIFSSGISVNGTGVVLTNRKINTSSGLGGGSDLTNDLTIGLTGLAYNLSNINSSGFIVTTGNNGVTTRIISASGSNILIGSGNGLSGNPIIGLNPYTSGLNTLQSSYLYSNSGYFNNVLQLNGTGVSITGHSHTISDISNFASGVSGLLPVTGIAAGYDISITNNSGLYTIASTNLVHVDSKQPQGFVNRTDSRISVSGNIFRIEPTGSSYSYYNKGIKVIKTSGDSLTIPNLTQINYIHFDTVNNQISNKTTAFDFSSDIPVAYIAWNSGVGPSGQMSFFAEERHGIVMDTSTHKWIHNTFGAQYVDGLSIDNYVLGGNGSSNTHATISIGNGTLYQEDIEINITDSSSTDPFCQELSPTGQIPVYYHQGSTGQWVKNTATNYPVKYGANGPQYNLLSGGTWTTPDVSPGGATRYFAVWILATNQIDDPIISIMGQRVDSNQGSAESNNSWSDVNLTNLPLSEVKPLYRLIFAGDSDYTNVPKCSLLSILDIRVSVISTIAGVSQNDHGSLFGLGDDDHSQYLHVDNARTVNAIHNFVNGINLTNNQGTLNVINDSGGVSINFGSSEAYNFGPSVATFENSISALDGNFTNALTVGGTGVSISGHTHNSSNITDFNSSVSGLLPTGTANYIVKFGTGGHGLNNSVIYESGDNIGIGTKNPDQRLTVNGVFKSNEILTKNLTINNSYGADPSLDIDVYSITNNNRLLIDHTNGVINLYDTLSLIGTNNSVYIGPNAGSKTPASKLDVSGIITATSGNSSNWNSAYNWGNHRSFGYASGTGVSGYLSRWNNTSGLNNSLIFDNGTNVGIGTTTPSGQLHVVSTGIGAIIGSYNEWTNGGKLRVYADDNDSQPQAIKSFISRTGVGLNIGFNATSYTIGGNGSGTNIGLYGYADNGKNNYGLYVDAGYGYFNSRVGIGTTNPTANLHVNGSGLFTSGLNTNGLNSFKDITILGKNDIPTWNQNALYNKTDVVKFENQYYVALENFTTECPNGVGPEGWYCCDGGIIALTPGDCPGGVGGIYSSSFSPTGYKPGWALLGSGDLAVQNSYSYNLYNHNNITSSKITVNDLLVKEGVIRVNNSFLNTFNMTINSSGINIVDTAANTTVNHVSTISLPAYLLSNTSWNAGTLFSIWETQANIAIGDLVLFTNFDSSIYNGIYKVETPLPTGDGYFGNIRFVRASGFINGTVLTNGISIYATKNSQKFILNKDIPGTSTVGSSSLLFTVDDGQSVMNILDNKDVVFSEGVSSQVITAEQKFFKIKHPDPESGYSHLQYGSLESPYNGVRLTGKNKLSKGICEVYLPNYLKHLIYEENISIQLTNYGHHKMLYVDKIDLKNNKFIVKGYRSKSGGPFNFYWSFTGIRKDVPNLIPEQ